MKKVFLMTALVIACTSGSTASAMNEAALNASQSEMMMVENAPTQADTTATRSVISGLLGGLLGGSSSSSSSSSTSSSASTSTAGNLITGLLDKVIGSGTFSKEDLCHTWKYSKPGCAFTSENLLAKAGGEVAAAKIEEQLAGYYTKFGITSSNTYFTFNTDGTFNAKIDGKSWNGKYTFDEKTHEIHLKGLLLSASGYATKTTTGISLLFDQKKLLKLIKALSAFKGSSTLSAVGSIANNFDGARVGFEMTK